MMMMDDDDNDDEDDDEDDDDEGCFDCEGGSGNDADSYYNRMMIITKMTRLACSVSTVLQNILHTSLHRNENKYMPQ